MPLGWAWVFAAATGSGDCFFSVFTMGGGYCTRDRRAISNFLNPLAEFQLSECPKSCQSVLVSGIEFGRGECAVEG